MKILNKISFPDFFTEVKAYDIYKIYKYELIFTEYLNQKTWEYVELVFKSSLFKMVFES